MNPTKEPKIIEEVRMGSLLLWAPDRWDKARELTPQEKIVAAKLDKFLVEKSMLQDELCWCEDCTKQARVWAREVQFDMKEGKAEANFRQVSSADYSGPVPGFCLGHIGTGPAQLAQAVYFSREEMKWGLKPKRWFVIFTDGSKQGGDCLQLDPKQIQPTIVEEFRESNGD